jgi:hypothetical protein
MTDSKAETPQSDKFRAIARELECDEDEAAFEEKVRKVAKSQPSQSDEKTPGG